MTIYRENDQIIELPRLRSGLDETQFKIGAATKATLYDKANVPVPGFIDIPMIYVATAPLPGTYRGQITEAFNPPIGNKYVLKVTAVEAGDDFKRVIPNVNVIDRPPEV